MASQAFFSVRPGPAPAMITGAKWYVSNGENTVGPVSADQIARGLLAGKVPRDARVAFVEDGHWRDILDVPEVIEALKTSRP